MRTMKVLATSILLCVSAAHAEWATDTDLADDALASAFRAGDPGTLDRAMVEARSDVAEKLRSSPDSKAISGTIVFSAGKTYEEIEQIIEVNALELTRAEAKNAASDQGRIATISVGDRSLVMLQGSIAERLAKSFGAHQLNLGVAIGDRRDAAAAVLAETAFKGHLSVYTIDVIGSTASFKELVERSDIAAIVLDDDDQKIAAHEMIRNLYDFSNKPGIRSVLGVRPEDLPAPPPGAQVIYRGANLESFRNLNQ